VSDPASGRLRDDVTPGDGGGGVGPAAKTAAGVHARRVIFIDLARALAVVFMLYGHAVDALLAPEYRSGALFEAWQFQRGLTSCLFLLLSGFAFSIATARHWTNQIHVSPRLLNRLRRFGLFMLLGYALHVPVSTLGELAHATEAQWSGFLAADVLQLIGASFIGVQLLVVITRSQRVFMITTLLLALGTTLLTPWVWSVDWTGRLPLVAAAYLSPEIGSQFPLFPWATFILIGAGLGQIYAHWGAAHLRWYANAALMAPGTAALLLWGAITSGPASVAIIGPFSFVPATILVRTGACAVILGTIAHISRFMTRLPHLFGAVAQESLVIYFVHLCIVYGSIWNTGLAQTFGATRSPRQMVLIVFLLIVAMTALAWYWNHWKHTRPHMARAAALALGALLLMRLL
jgi:uncharacterized membrane protein